MQQSQHESDQPQVNQVKIQNNNAFELRDAFDSQPYVFPPKKAITIPMAAARHIFGFHMDSTEAEVYNHITRRFGWNRPDNAEQARMYFSNLEIRPVMFRMVEVPIEDEAPTPAPNMHRVPMKSGPKMRAAANPDAESDTAG